MTKKKLPTAKAAISGLTGHVRCFWSSNLHFQFDCYMVKKELFIFNYRKPYPYLHQTTEPQGSYENYTYLDEGPLVHHELQYQCICTLSASCIC